VGAHIRSLADLTADHVELAGGKGANLGGLIRAGVSVPPGFVVTTSAYRHAAAGRPGPPRQVPADLAAEIQAAYAELSAAAVAVRSSATTEDLTGAAFAGQHDTFLNVRGETDLLAAVVACWVSLWSGHAVDYRRRAGLDTPDVAMAVVVQRMVDAEMAGVMFTADPVTGARDRVVVDAVRGLGEALVSGRTTADHYVVDKHTAAVLDYAPGGQEVAVRARASGGIEEGRVAGAGPVLDPDQLAGLVAIGRAIETAFGSPQDIEWTGQGGELLVVQARAMTALPDEPGPRTLLRRGQRLFLRVLGDMMPSRPYPMDATLWVPEAYAGVRQFMSAAGVRWRRTSGMFVERDGVVVSLEVPEPSVTPLTPLRLLRSAVGGQPYTRARFLGDPEVRRVLDEVAVLRALDLSRVSYAELAAPLRTGVSSMRILLGRRRPYVARSGLRAARLAVVLGLLGRPRLLPELLSGVDTKTTEANRDLERLAARVRASPVLSEGFHGGDPLTLPEVLAGSTEGREFLADHAAFLAEHGHREGALLLISQPCWADDPAATLGAISAMARTSGTAEGQGTARAEQQLFAHPVLRPALLRNVTQRWLAAARTLTQFREDTHYYATIGIPMVRRILGEYGRRLVEAGVLDRAEDVHHLRAAELDLTWPPDYATVARLRSLVVRRARLRHSLAGEGWPPVGVDEAVETDALLTGTGASAGRVTGPVRLVTSSADFSGLRAGEVLVAPYTNPSWTPLFALAAAVVVDTGSVGSHAAIVAREYGIPAVLGTRTATATLTDGQLITVDGTHGRVVAA